MKKYLFIWIIGCTLLGCEDFNNQNPVPYVPVNYTLNITSEYPHFISENGFQTMTLTRIKFERESVGYSGLLIWIGMDGQYHAADLCCPNCLIKTKPVKVDGIYAVCPTCEETYDISYGYAFPTKGKTKFPLRKYQTFYKNSYSGYTLRIAN
jgi:nitrite reductase/ring-hydroxylating ferredoxin subunit